jgi:broad specificity phosphatase PhoE
MSRIFLLRHAQSLANQKGILSGRLPDFPLSKVGLKQRDSLKVRLEGANFDQIISSPIQRCLETINFLTPEIFEDFQEVHYGDWSGKRMSSLARNKAWREIYSNPTGVRFPNGETLPEVQIRALAGLEKINKQAKNILIATHADVVKALLLHALGSHLNNIDKVQINNASISIIENGKNGLRVLRVNDDTSLVKDLLA